MFAIYEQDGTKTHEVVTEEGSKTIFGFNDSLLDGVINTLMSQDFLFEVELYVCDNKSFKLTFASKLTIMLPTGFVVTDDTHDVLPILVLCPSALIVRTLLGDITGGNGCGCWASQGRCGAVEALGGVW